LTASIASVSLCTAALICVRRDRKLLAWVTLLSALGGLAAVGSTMEYNWALTGDPLLSPYALIRGLRVPAEVTASPSSLLGNLAGMWRFSAQNMWVLCFPFVFVLAAIGLYGRRRMGAAWIAACLFGAMCVGHFVQVESSSSTIGERYWFEAFFCILVLSSPVMARLMTTPMAWTLSAVQVLALCGAIRILEQRAEPRIAMRSIAERYRNCDCVVFMKERAPYFGPQHLNINDPDWRTARVFYLRDPGESARSLWAARFGRTRWAVLEYDARLKVGRLSVDESKL